MEKYLIEIARYYNVEYEPDPMVMNQDEVYSAGNIFMSNLAKLLTWFISK